MKKQDLHIEIVRSTNVSLSSMSQESCDAIYGVLSQHFTTVGVSLVDSIADVRRIADMRPDLVFLGMKCVPGDDFGTEPRTVWLGSYFSDRGIATTGSASAAHYLESDKSRAKRRVMAAGIDTSAYCVVAASETLSADSLPANFPLFIKPANRGGGQGVDEDSVVYSFEAAQRKIREIATVHGADSIVESYLAGREFSVAVLRDHATRELLAMPIELIAPSDTNGNRILGSMVKSSNAEQAVRVTDTDTWMRVTSFALDVFDALGARDYGRIDIRMDTAGTPFFLEANLIPSLIAGYGSFPKACVLNYGIEYEAMILRIVELGLTRSRNMRTRTKESRQSPVFAPLLARVA